MPDNLVIPGWVWWMIVKAVALTIFAIGLAVVAVFWKTGRLPFAVSRVTDKHNAGPERRTNDVIITKLVEALMQSGQKIGTEIHDLTMAIREQATATNEGFRDLHRKIEALSREKQGGAHGNR